MILTLFQEGGDIGPEGRIPENARRASVHRDLRDVVHFPEVQPYADVFPGPEESTRIGGRAGKILEIGIFTFAEIFQDERIKGEGNIQLGGEGNVPDLPQIPGFQQSSFLYLLFLVARGLLGKDHEEGLPGIQCEADGIGRSGCADGSVVRVPQFGRLRAGREGHRPRSIFRVDDKVNVGPVRFPLDPILRTFSQGALLKKHLAAGEVGKECLTGLEPSLVAAEVRAPPSHSHSGLVTVVEGLVHPVVQEEAVRAGDKGPVGRMLEEGWVFRVVAHFRTAGESFGPHDGLAVFPGLVHDGFHDTAAAARPEFAHGNVGHKYRLGGAEGAPIRLPEKQKAFFVHFVAGHLPSVLQEAALDEDAPVFLESRIARVLRVRLPKRHTGQRIITADPFEIFPETGGPILLPGLVTVYE